jgi:hypothetical protein
MAVYFGFPLSPVVCGFGEYFNARVDLCNLFAYYILLNCQTHSRVCTIWRDPQNRESLWEMQIGTTASGGQGRYKSMFPKRELAMACRPDSRHTKGGEKMDEGQERTQPGIRTSSSLIKSVIQVAGGLHIETRDIGISCGGTGKKFGYRHR